MSYTVGDGSVVLALAAGVVGYLYVKHQSHQKKTEIIHQERMAAMEKGIPLPEFPLERDPGPHQSVPDNVIPILGTVLFTLSLGTMIALYLTRDAASHNFWIAPLPFTFLGVGLIVFHFLNREPRR
jgi:hypothetical protein